MFAITTEFFASQIAPVLAYIGPDLLLPLTSALAAILGVLLLFWQKTVALAVRVWRLLFHRQR